MTTTERQASPAAPAGKPLVGIAMGSSSDLAVMQAAADILQRFDVPHELRVLSAHRTPEAVAAYAREAATRGLRVLIGGAGGAAHLPGMLAAHTPLPVIGVPVSQKLLDGLDSLLSIVQMPRGVPVATVAIDNATNAAVLAVQILATADPALLQRVQAYKEELAETARSQDASLTSRS
jgi:5-(carboxyamino)imidazole ribonucleotide mutase